MGVTYGVTTRELRRARSSDWTEIRSIAGLAETAGRCPAVVCVDDGIVTGVMYCRRPPIGLRILGPLLRAKRLLARLKFWQPSRRYAPLSMFDVIDGTIATHPTLGRSGQATALLRFVNGDAGVLQEVLEPGENLLHDR